MSLGKKIINNLNESSLDNAKTFTFSPEIVAKVQAEYNKNKPEIVKELRDEFRMLVRELLKVGFTKEELLKLPVTTAYEDAMKDPENIWCNCGKDNGSKYKPDGESYLGVSKHGYICNKCRKYTQIG